MGDKDMSSGLDVKRAMIYPGQSLACRALSTRTVLEGGKAENSSATVCGCPGLLAISWREWKKYITWLS